MPHLAVKEQIGERQIRFHQKNGPGKPGPSLGGTIGAQPGRAVRFCRFGARGGASEPRIGKIIIADREARMGHQQAIDGGHHAAEQRGRRHQAERGGLGTYCPLIAVQRIAAVLIGAI